MLKDRDIREPLFFFLEEEYGKTRFIEEKTMGRSRADVLMVTEDALIGIEIKSDADTYERLASQVKDYDKLCDYNYIAAGSSHAMHVEEHVPDYWGIITIDETEEGADFYILRRPKLNPKVKTKNQVSLLWRPELNHLLAANGMHAYKEKSKAFVIGRLLEKVPEETLKAQLFQELFERDYTAIAGEIEEYRKERRKSRTSAKRAPGSASAARKKKVRGIRRRTKENY